VVVLTPLGFMPQQYPGGRAVVDELLTVQEMAGFQMMVAKLDAELLRLWDAPCDTPYMTVR
jgi:dihydroxyacetone kinase